MLDSDVKYAKPRFPYAVLMEMLGDRIKMLRIAKGLSQSDLAQLVGVTKSAVSQWELSQTANVKLATFLRLCDALGVRPEYLIFGPGKAGEKRTAQSGGSAKN